MYSIFLLAMTFKYTNLYPLSLTTNKNSKPMLRIAPRARDQKCEIFIDIVKWAVHHTLSWKTNPDSCNTYKFARVLRKSGFPDRFVSHISLINWLLGQIYVMSDLKDVQARLQPKFDTQWVEIRVSVQGVKSFGGHFACLCREFHFYEVKNIIVFLKENGNTFTLLIIFIV